jgi:predicted DNA-binding antitoxin AbrB/MazE fold protein
MRVIEARYEEGLLRLETPLALTPGELVTLIVVRHPDPRRWNLERLAKSGASSVVRLPSVLLSTQRLERSQPSRSARRSVETPQSATTNLPGPPPSGRLHRQRPPPARSPRQWDLPRHRTVETPRLVWTRNGYGKGTGASLRTALLASGGMPKRHRISDSLH